MRPQRNHNKPVRTVFADGIIAEVMIPEKETGRVIILCPGLPGSPCKNPTLKVLARRGYTAIFPRYRGSWESRGIFLDNPPTDDISDIVHELIGKKIIFDLYTGKKISLRVRELFVIGNSFGGPAAIFMSNHPEVKKVVALSPVIDWHAEHEGEPFALLERYVRRGFGGAYRLRRFTDWKKLIETDFYNPIAHWGAIDGSKLMIIHAEDDEITPIGPAREFATLTTCSRYWKRVGGHFSIAHLEHEFFWKKIERFFTSRP